MKSWQRNLRNCLNPSLAGTTSPTLVAGKRNAPRCNTGLNPSLAGTTSPTTNKNNEVMYFVFSLNPSLAGTTSPTGARTNPWYAVSKRLNPSLAGTTSPTPENDTCLKSCHSLNPSLAGTTSPTGSFSRAPKWKPKVLILL